MGCAGQVDLGVFGYAGSVANTIFKFWRGWMSPKGHPALLAYLGTFLARETYLTDTSGNQRSLRGKLTSRKLTVIRVYSSGGGTQKVQDTQPETWLHAQVRGATRPSGRLSLLLTFLLFFLPAQREVQWIVDGDYRSTSDFEIL